MPQLMHRSTAIPVHRVRSRCMSTAAVHQAAERAAGASSTEGGKDPEKDPDATAKAAPATPPPSTPATGASSSSGASASPTSPPTPAAGSASSESSSAQPQGGKKKHWGPFKWLMAIGGAAAAATFAYFLHKANYNVALAELLFMQWIKDTFDPPRIPQNVTNAKFQVALHPDLQHELGTYFLQLDLDKENGVRRTDALALVEKLGFPSAKEYDETVDTWLRRGRKQESDKKKLMGCCLQEVAELVESLILLEEKSATNQGIDSGASSFAAQQLDSGTAPSHQDATTASSSSAGAAAAPTPMSSSQQRVYERLKELNPTPTPSLLPPFIARPKYHPRPVMGSPPHREEEEKTQDAEELDMYELELAQLKRLEAEIIQRKTRRGLSEVESARLGDIRADIAETQRRIRTLKNKGTLFGWGIGKY
ncbi:unnamed protein product [Vitrella brassicaformis CCMP3155]|uniref:Uncharacterized protein n=1 Tax=Vitrella brassicaformis (strain CCMP3155) TaxID=1169540 RepID=A0A0G4GLD7_VITBC|nr:unnamed protein product [Vitrella brassicaformis CCMP3155]|eukprot:CEM30932.1 unnamed protein product [Vitrella brassicaformis CCMP3155]